MADQGMVMIFSVVAALLLAAVVFFKMMAPAKGPKKRAGALDRMRAGEAAEEDAPAGEDAGGRRQARRAERNEHEAAARREQDEKNERQSKKAEKYSAKIAEREAARLAREEEERLAQEAKEKAEHEEFLLWKDMISVEAEGETAGEANAANVLSAFIEHVKMHKVVLLEELAAEFRMKTSAVVSRIEELEASGQLTGIFDDRGKYVHITADEMEGVRSFIRGKGRVSHAEVVAAANRLIRLEPTAADQAILEEKKKQNAAALDEEAAA